MSNADTQPRREDFRDSEVDFEILTPLFQQYFGLKKEHPNCLMLMRVGDYARTGTANINVVDTDSFWIDGYFEETKMSNIRVGDTADVKLMGFDHKQLTYRFNGRDFRLTDVAGNVIDALIA